MAQDWPLVVIVLLSALGAVFFAVSGIRAVVNRKITYRFHSYTGKAAIVVGLLYITISCCGAYALISWISQGFPR